MPSPPGLTAVIVDVPAASPVVGSWRARFDSSAPLGVPPHVTILFPFLSLPAMTATDRADLAAIVGAEPGFTVTFAALGTFATVEGTPEVLYLEPSPAEPFRRLTEALAARWPQCPPYEGAFDEVIPHLTVTETAPPEQVSAARRAIARVLPIRASIDTVTLIDFDGTRWRRHMQFPMGGTGRS
ncbi:MAG TPA: 2'-5' RNA ligase family protein [Nakamurella sp.]